MAPIVNLENVGVTLGVTTLFSSLSLGVQDGDRIGVLGLNGSGKSTLMAVLGGRLEPHAGRIAVTRGTRIEMVDQATDLDPSATVRDVALQTFGGAADHHWASDSTVRGVLTGLGLGNIGLDTPLGGLSGGEQRRVTLAAALVTDADLLILDEPTNHLDIEGISWLADHLLARRGALIAVTHDRWFLDAVATTTWEVVDERVEIREGGYSDWVFARAERLRLAQAAEERRQNLARKELAWLRRGPPARTSKPRYRIEAAEALIADVPEARNSTELHSFARRRLGKDVVDVEDLTVALPVSPAESAPGFKDGDDEGSDTGRVLLDRVTWRIGPGDRLGVVGVNGSGKSTLLRVLTDDPDDAAAASRSLIRSGMVKRGQTVEIGYLSQDAAELPADLRLLEAVSEIAGTVNLGGRDMTASQLAEQFGFTHAQQWTRVGALSGGQRRRLQLMRILMASPNVLILDEPTNDLDTDTLTSLEDLLDSWPGTMIVVSHDRYLIERVTDDVYALFGDGRLTHLPGGVDEYLRRRALQPVVSAVASSGPRSGSSARWEQSGPSAPSKSGGSKSVESKSVESNSAGSSRSAASSSSRASAEPADGAAPAPARDAGELRALRKDLQRLEKRLESLQRKQDQLHSQLTDVGADYARASELDGQLRAAVDEHAEVELAWLEVAEKLEG